MLESASRGGLPGRGGGVWSGGGLPGPGGGSGVVSDPGRVVSDPGGGLPGPGGVVWCLIQGGVVSDLGGGSAWSRGGLIRRGGGIPACIEAEPPPEQNNKQV